jgi:hypothetical protein
MQSEGVKPLVLLLLRPPFLTPVVRGGRMQGCGLWLSEGVIV